MSSKYYTTDALGNMFSFTRATVQCGDTFLNTFMCYDNKIASLLVLESHTAQRTHTHDEYRDMLLTIKDEM